METERDEETFYAIRSAWDERCWWKTLDGGSMCDSWGDVATADRYDTPEEAEEAVREEAEAECIDLDEEDAPGVVCKVRVRTVVDWSDCWDDFDLSE